MSMLRLLYLLLVFMLWAAMPGLSGTAASAATLTTLTVPLAGTVDGPPESVAFSGPAQLKATAVAEADAAAPSKVVLSIDLSKVVGVGSSTGKKYVTSAQEILTRPLSVADLFEVTFVFFPNGERGAAARVGMASFNLGFDMDSGQLIGAEAAIAPPVFPENDGR